MPTLNPIKYLRFTKRIFDYSGRVKGRTTLSRSEQAREVYQLLRCNLLEPKEYYQTYELFEPGLSWDEKRRFLSRNQFAIIDPLFNPRGGTGVFNKMVFKVFAQQHDLPVARSFGLFDQHHGYFPDGKPLRSQSDLRRLIDSLDGREFLFKPISADKAMGIIICSAAAGQVSELGKGPISLDDLYQRLCSGNFGGNQFVRDSWLIEEKARQHEWFDRFTTTLTHNYRIVTFLTAAGNVQLLGTGFGVGVSGQYLHLSGPRGISAGISEDGKFGRGVTNGGPQIEYFDQHPETGAQISGESAPQFAESLEVARRAHRLLPHLRLLGWDIAATDKGPIIFEGNTYWNWEKLQRCNRRGIVYGEFGEELPRVLAGLD